MLVHVLLSYTIDIHGVASFCSLQSVLFHDCIHRICGTAWGCRSKGTMGVVVQTMRGMRCGMISSGTWIEGEVGIGLRNSKAKAHHSGCSLLGHFI